MELDASERRESRVPALAALGLAIVGVVLLTYFAVAIQRTHDVVEASLPCEPEVITNTEPIIDPAGYHLYAEAEVEASKAWEACMDGARALFEREGISTLSNSVYAPLIALADLAAAALLTIAWALAVLARIGRWWSTGLGVLTVAGLAAISFQIRYAETIELVSWIVD